MAPVKWEKRNEQDVARRLARFIEAQGFDRVTVENLAPLGGGTSRPLWGFDAILQKEGGVERRRFVARADPPASHLGSISRREEFEVLRALRRAGVPAPEALWYSADSSVLGSPFFVMERVEGESAPRPLLRDDRYSLARALAPRALARALARLHRVDTTEPGVRELPRMGDPAPWATLRYYQELFGRIALEPRPVIELAFRWLFRHVPADGPQCLVHGDFRLGNFVYDERGIRAIVDWEFAHVGHPMEDLSWLSLRTWRFGVDELEVGGLCRLEPFLDEYESAGGPPVDRRTLRFWEVFAHVRWAVITIAQARNHLDGYTRDVELAAIGRRAAENEFDLLSLIDSE